MPMRLPTAWQEQKINFVSFGVVANPNSQLGFSKALVVRDPDGHAIEIVADP
jgi:hypothetical protein